MKYYCGDFNGILEPLKQRVGTEHLATPRDADAWVVFQDVLGSYGDLIKHIKILGFDMPVFCVQHGRGSTTDYAYPNKLPFQADKYLCWGKADYDRMVSLGYGDRTQIVGCPLLPQIQPKVAHEEKLVLFVPVNTGKEEPQNLEIYYELLKLKYTSAQAVLSDNRLSFNKKWGYNGKPNVSFNDLNKGCDVVAKLLPWHDRNLYHGNTVLGFQQSHKNNELLFSLLRNVDCVVGLDEGTTEMFAYAHDIPVVICEGFKYKQHPNDKDAVEIDGYKTEAADYCTLETLAEKVQYALSHPEHKKEERKAVALRELGTDQTDPTGNILKAIKSHFLERKAQ